MDREEGRLQDKRAWHSPEDRHNLAWAAHQALGAHDTRYDPSYLVGSRNYHGQSLEEGSQHRAGST